MSQGHAPAPSDPRTVDIFVSYSARSDQERELAACLIDLLTGAFALPARAVFAYTMPGRGATSGARLVDELKDALAESRVVLAVVTPAAAESSFSQFEMAASDLGGKDTVPLLPDPSFQPHVPMLFRDVTARSLASVGELCQLLEDLKEPLGRPHLEPPCLWITKAERLAAVAQAVAGHVTPEARVAALTADLGTARREYRSLRRTALTAVAVGLAAALAFAGVWARHMTLRADHGHLRQQLELKDGDIAHLTQSLQEITTRFGYQPALTIEGTVTTALGTPAEGASVLACAALPALGAAAAAGDICPEDSVLRDITDDQGIFRVGLTSLPIPGRVRDGQALAPIQEIWLVAQHEDGARVERVRTVLDRRLTLR